jgi:DNA uptake protein ComE-like DNA-binding protein
MKSWKTLAGAAALASVLAAPLAAQVGKPITIVDPNVAGEKELAALPHMNDTLVKAVVAGRPFLSMADLHALLVKSLQKEQLAELYGRMFVHVNLNTATRDEILLIPGVGSRMLHEFEEYRPYPALAKFHREIDKYVDDSELARLEQYVFVPIDLNAASDADILSIPGVGQRLLREFKEYRPYTSIEQFRREIGKYVDKKEVARLERYVAIK